MESAQPDLKEEKHAISWGKAALLTLWPIPLTVAQNWVLPGYLAAFLAPNHVVCRALFFAAVTWMLLGLFLMRRCKGVPMRWVVFWVFPCPAMMVAFLGPTLIAFFETFAPMMTGS